MEMDLLRQALRQADSGIEQKPSITKSVVLFQAIAGWLPTYAKGFVIFSTLFWHPCYIHQGTRMCMSMSLQ
jgi:hypothetical protein